MSENEILQMCTAQDTVIRTAYADFNNLTFDFITDCVSVFCIYFIFMLVA